MRSITISIAGLALVCIAPVAAPQQIDGTWVGVADAKPDGGLPVTLKLEVSTVRESARIALTLPESRQVRLTIPSPYSDSAAASYRDGVLRLEFTPDIGLGFIGRLGPRSEERIAFEGRLEGPDRLAGTMRITSYVSRIVLKRVSVSAADHREVPVTFVNETDSLRLGGTLLVPNGPPKPRVVVFVTGSDPDTRDAWRYEATMLLRRGVASLLYDKRGVGESTGASHDLASWDDLAGDLRGAIAFLASRPELVDTERIGVIGQSQGTWIIAKVAPHEPRVKFVVSIAGSGMSAAAQETYRTSALMRRDVFPESEIAKAVAFQRQKFQVARTGLGWQTLDSTMQRLRADSVPWFPGYGTGAATRSLAVLRLYGVLQFNYDPAHDLKQIMAPTLIIMGQRDLNFPPSTVIERMEAALREGGNHCVQSAMIADASHGLLVEQTYRGKPFRRVISEEFLRVLGNWVPLATECSARRR
jgi:pimeloyl-ACP methyl ester carboxylesterase